METQTKIMNFEQNLVQSNNENDDDDKKIAVIDRTEMCENWLENCSISDTCSVDSDYSAITDTTTNSAMESGFQFQTNEVVVSNQILTQKHEPLIINHNKGGKGYEVNVYKSRKVHVGDVTYINGPVIINNNNSVRYDSKVSEPYNDLGLEGSLIIDRLNWLAQPRLGEIEYLPQPAKFVIICHTATEEQFSQAGNTLLVRLMQTFHIESRKWKDIAYNYLIGSDGLVYEGRGWGVIASHTRNYNSKSLGIAFIGTFLDHLPPATSLQKARDLIDLGVKRGSIAEDYILLAHCQCSPLESPGRRLFEEIKTWPRWDGSYEVPKTNFSVSQVKEQPDDDNVPSPNVP